MNKRGFEQEMVIRILVWIAIFIIGIGGIWALWKFVTGQSLKIILGGVI